jgi:PAS domain S-box-containing protein
MHSESFELFKELSFEYHQLSDDELNYEKICDDIHRISGAAYTVINILTKDKKHTQTVAISGINDHLKFVSALLGYHVIGKKWEIDDFAHKTMCSKKLINQGDLETSTPHIKKTISSVIKKTFNVGDIYSIGIFNDSEVIGTIVFVTKANTLLHDHQLIELFSYQISAFVYKVYTIRFLKEEINRLNIITDSSSDVHILTNESSQILSVNKSFLNIDKDNLIGQNLVHIINDNKLRFESIWNVVLINKEFLVKDFELNYLDGQKLFFNVTILPNVLNNKISNIHVIFRDITKEKKLSEKVFFQNKLLRETNRMAKIGVWELKNNKFQLLGSKELFNLIGIKDVNIVDVDLVLNFFNEPERKKLEDSFDRLKHGNGNFELDISFIDKNSLIKWQKWIGYTSFSDQGDKIIIGIIQDISNLQNSLIDQKHTSNQLAQFQNAINTAAIISKFNSEGIITYVNKNFLKSSLYNPNEVLGKNHMVLNSDFHTSEFWDKLWNHIKSGLIWKGEIKKRQKMVLIFGLMLLLFHYIITPVR